LETTARAEVVEEEREKRKIPYRLEKELTQFPNEFKSGLVDY